MWLRYGVDRDNKLVAIEDVPSGKNQANVLTVEAAAKALSYESLQAHAGDTCYPIIKKRTAHQK